MKILWFTNTPCSASEILYPGLNGGGWLSSLEKELSVCAEVELYIAFYHSKNIEPFSHNNTHFIPIYRRYSSSKMERYLARLFKQEYNDKSEIDDLIKTIELIQPDLIHVHGTEENFGLIQNQTQIPVIVSIQGVLCSIEEKFYTGIPESVANRSENFKNRIFLKSAKYSFNILHRKADRERKILYISKNIIGRTDFDKRVTRVLAPESKYFICHEILRQSFYSNQWDQRKFNEKLCIVSIISDSTYKGFEIILKTAKILSKNPKLKYEWLVAGINERSNITIISQAWLKTNHKHLNIKLLGGLDEFRIVSLLKSSDIFCQVSHIENSPNSLCEAMILGMPCIASFSGGTSSMIESNKEGILVQDGDPYVLAGAILELSYDYIKASSFGQNARNSAQKRHDRNLITHNMINIYKSITKG